MVDKTCTVTVTTSGEAQMGLFSRKPKAPAGPPSLDGTRGWQLRGGSNVPFAADDSWADGVRARIPKVPRVGHEVEVALKRDSDGIVWVFSDGQQVGHLDAAASKEYESAFNALERTGRHGIVQARIEPRDWKSGGACFIDIAYKKYPCIPFNQPPVGIPQAGFTELDVKDEAKFKDTIQTISRGMNASPGWFIIGQADGTGQHPVYAPFQGKPMEQCQVGYVNKAGTGRASEATASGPVWVAGMVWWRDTTPQVVLASWYS